VIQGHVVEKLSDVFKKIGRDKEVVIREGIEDFVDSSEIVSW
jgi:predicted DNA-binding protein